MRFFYLELCQFIFSEIELIFRFIYNEQPFHLNKLSGLLELRSYTYDRIVTSRTQRLASLA